MGLKDTVAAKYMRQNDVFADVFNFYIYGGEQVIDPANLVEMDTREIEVPYGGTEGAEQPVQKVRDVIKSLAAMTDRKTAYLVLAIENQSNVHYAMPVKNMVYDAVQYSKQVEKAAVSHRLSGDYTGSNNDEYLSKFKKTDHLMPVVTLVIYFSPDEWDGPVSIHDMFKDQDERVLALVPDYKINLLSPATIADGDFDKFQTSLREVLSFMKNCRDESNLEALLESDKKFQHLGREEVDMLNAYTNARIEMQNYEEAVNVCEAIEQMKLKAAEKAAKEAEKETRVKVLWSSIEALMENYGWTETQAMHALNVSAEDQETLAWYKHQTAAM